MVVALVVLSAHHLLLQRRHTLEAATEATTTAAATAASTVLAVRGWALLGSACCPHKRPSVPAASAQAAALEAAVYMALLSRYSGSRALACRQVRKRAGVATEHMQRSWQPLMVLRPCRRRRPMGVAMCLWAVLLHHHALQSRSLRVVWQPWVSRV